MSALYRICQQHTVFPALSRPRNKSLAPVVLTLHNLVNDYLLLFMRPDCISSGPVTSKPLTELRENIPEPVLLAQCMCGVGMTVAVAKAKALSQNGSR
jgi:hypothetical protein